jgi:hypothetical protein
VNQRVSWDHPSIVWLLSSQPHLKFKCKFLWCWDILAQDGRPQAQKHSAWHLASTWSPGECLPPHFLCQFSEGSEVATKAWAVFLDCFQWCICCSAEHRQGCQGWSSSGGRTPAQQDAQSPVLREKPLSIPVEATINGLVQAHHWGTVLAFTLGSHEPLTCSPLTLPPLSQRTSDTLTDLKLT